MAQRTLREILEELYDDQESAQRLVEEAGLPSAGIRFSQSARQNWHNILTEAGKHKIVRALVEAASKEYPARADELERAYQAFLRAEEERGKDELKSANQASSFTLLEILKENVIVH